MPESPNAIAAVSSARLRSEANTTSMPSSRRRSPRSAARPRGTSNPAPRVAGPGPPKGGAAPSAPGDPPRARLSGLLVPEPVGLRALVRERDQAAERPPPACARRAVQHGAGPAPHLGEVV